MRIFKLYSAQIANAWNFDLRAIIFAFDAFLLQIFSELLHIIRPHPKHIQRLNTADIPGYLRCIGKSAPLKAFIKSLQSYTASKKLDDLRSLRAPHIHKTHCGYTPTVPS